MPTSPRTHFPFPDENSNPWAAVFESMVDAIDTSLYTIREDRNIIIMGGGTMTFTAGTGVLTWAADIDLFAAVTGYLWRIQPGNTTVADGQLIYITVTRAPQSLTTYTMLIGSQTPNEPAGDNHILIGVRRGSKIHFRDGFLISDGDSLNVFDTSGGGSAGAVIFDGGSPLNMRGARTSGQSPINNTKSGIVNLGSRSTGASVGATKDFATIGGGDQNVASGDYATVPGGLGNVASGNFSFAVGQNCVAFGTNSCALGLGGSASGFASLAAGTNCVAQGVSSLVHGENARAFRPSQYAHAYRVMGGAGNGDAGQFSRVGYVGDSVNGVAQNLNDSTLTGVFTLEASKAYAARVTFVLHRMDVAGNPSFFVHDLFLTCPGGVATIVQDNVTLSVPNGNTWTVATTPSAGDITFSVTGEVGKTVRCVATVEFTELRGFI